MAITHTSVKAPGQKLFAVADWNANHAGTAPPEQHANEAHNPDMAEKPTYDAHDHSAADPTQVDHANLTNVSSDQHHARQHSIISTSDHTSAATGGQMLKADLNGLPVNATNTDFQVSVAVTHSAADYAYATKTTDQTIPQATHQLIDYADGNVAVGTITFTPATDRWTVGTAGMYLITAKTVVPMPDADYLASEIYVNGAERQTMRDMCGLASIPSVIATAAIYLNAGDYVQHYCYHSYAGNRTLIDAYFSIVRLV